VIREVEKREKERRKKISEIENVKEMR